MTHPDREAIQAARDALFEDVIVMAANLVIRKYGTGADFMSDEEWRRQYAIEDKSAREKYAALQPAQAVRRVDGELIAAAKAVVERWEMPSWKDAEPTARFIYRLRDALQEAGTDAGGWMDIESAPKPSGQLILAVPRDKPLSGYDVVNGHWYSTYNKWVYDCHFSPKGQPTKWMPLPPAPQKGD